MTLAEGTNLLSAVAATIGAVAALWAVVVSKRTLVVGRAGVAVSTDNKVALAMVQTKQDENKTALTSQIDGVTHAIKNGLGANIVTATIEQIKPALEEAGKVITDQVTTQVAQTAEKVATALVEKAKAWDGDERRVGPADRRGQ